MTSPAANPPARSWWEGRPYALLLIALSAVPLVAPPIPPLVDLLGHMGRYRVQLDIGSSPYLAQYFGFKWGILANLGVDLLVQALAPLMGLEPAVKLIVLCIPPITVAGLIGIVRETHGRVPATAAFALPLAWGYPFQFGFVNFALSMGLAMCAFAFWLRLGRLGWWRLRIALFIPIGIAIWFAHIFGWGVLGLLVYSAELVASRRKGRGFVESAFRAGLACWPISLPLLLMAAWREQAQGVTGDFFFWRTKLAWLASVLRDRWITWDLIGAVILYTLALTMVFERRFRVDPVLALAALVLGITFALLPRILLGSAYADMRLSPTVVICLLLAFTPSGFGQRAQGVWAAAATLFFVSRVVSSTISLDMYSDGWRAQMPALDHIERGARVLALTSLPCGRAWHTSRMEHLSSLATVRREAFVNDQWVMPGAQLLTIHYEKGGHFTQDPSQIVRPTRRCRGRTESLLDPSLATFPRDAFDYVWLIDLPPSRRPVDYPELVPLWYGARSGALYRVDHTVSGTPRSD